MAKMHAVNKLYIHDNVESITIMMITISTTTTSTVKFLMKFPAKRLNKKLIIIIILL